MLGCIALAIGALALGARAHRDVVQVTVTLREAELRLRDPDSPSSELRQWVRHFAEGAPDDRSDDVRAPACSILGPVVRVAPGQTLEIRVFNDLPRGTDGVGLRIRATGLQHPSVLPANRDTHTVSTCRRRASRTMSSSRSPRVDRNVRVRDSRKSRGWTYWVHPHWHSAETLQVGGEARFR